MLVRPGLSWGETCAELGEIGDPIEGDAPRNEEGAVSRALVCCNRWGCYEATQVAQKFAFSFWTMLPPGPTTCAYHDPFLAEMQ
jgi:hypothetical protein